MYCFLKTLMNIWLFPVIGTNFPPQRWYSCIYSSTPSLSRGNRNPLGFTLLGTQEPITCNATLTKIISTPYTFVKVCSVKDWKATVYLGSGYSQNMQAFCYYFCQYLLQGAVPIRVLMSNSAPTELPTHRTTGSNALVVKSTGNRKKSELRD